MIHVSIPLPDFRITANTDQCFYFSNPYKAAHASGLATNLAFNTMKAGIGFATLGPDF